jgi:hypothetical protein
MQRPDQEKFDQFAHPFKEIDGFLEDFCRSNDLILEVNLLRQPCRVLRWKRNESLFIDISYDDFWRDTEFDERLPQSIAAIGYYYPPNDEYWIWRHEKKIIQSRPFSEIKERLPAALGEAVRTLFSWTPDTMVREGQRQENIVKKVERRNKSE